MDLTFEEFQKKLPFVNDPKERIHFIQNFVWISDDLFPKDFFLKGNLELIDEAFDLSLKINDRWGLAYGYVNKAYFGLYVTHDPKTFENFKIGLDIFNEIKDDEGLSRTLNMMSYSLLLMGKYDEAFEYAFAALRHAEEVKNVDFLGWANFALGIFKFDLKEYEASEKYFKKAFEFFSSGKNKVYATSRCRNELGKVMIATKHFDEAIEYIRLAIDGYSELNNMFGKSRALNDMGVILKIQKKYDSAEKSLKESLQLREDSNYFQGITTTCYELGGLYLKTKNYNEALKYLHQSLEIAEKTKSKPKIFQIHEALGEVYKETNELGKALEHKEKFYEVKMEVTGEQATNKLKHLETQFATEKSEKEAEIHRLKNVELKKAYQEIEEKNKSIIDSINYAKLIQEAILPSHKELNQLLPEAFVLYKPKDVVSGDFYWVAKKNNKIIIAAVDCTGHGVPGAFMSMIGNTLLNEIVIEKGVTTPNEILFQLREGIIKSLKQTGINGENQDGMDISLITLEGLRLEYAGANNPLWIFSENEIKIIKADKQPIGIYLGNPKPFTNHCLDLEKGDCIYIFSDGFADQFGDSDKKLLSAKFKETLMSIRQMSMSDQQIFLDNFIENWRGQREQTDDILVMGVRIG